MQEEIGQVNCFLNSIHVHTSPEWLEACIEWCKNEVLGHNYTFENLRNKIYEQWLILDLRDLETAVLPANLGNQKLFVLNKNYSLQMMQVVDISKPKYWQLERIRKNILPTRLSKQQEDEVGSGKRVLQLTLTDGVQFVEAMEYTPISGLNINLRPGIKIQLLSPVTVRRGRLMLKPQNIKILGGEVAEILISHAAENVLARALNLPENPSPELVDVSVFSEENTDEGTNDVNSNRNRNNLEQNRKNNVINTNINISRSLNQTNHTTPEEQKKIDEEISLIMEMENEFTWETTDLNSGPAPRRKNTPPSDLFKDNYSDSDFDNLDNLSNLNTQVKNNRVTEVSSGTENKLECGSLSTKNCTETTVYDISSDLDFGDDIFENIDEELEKIEKEKIQSLSPKMNIISISKLLETRPNVCRGRFKIRGRFNCVVEKLTVNEEGFSVVIKVEDNSGEIDCQVHSDVVSQIAGHKPCEMVRLRETLHSNPSSRQQVISILQQVRDGLVKIDNILDLQINNRDSNPVIINIL